MIGLDILDMPEPEDVKVIYNKLYKLDNKNNYRVWWMEQDNEKYRTHSGILDGTIVVSEWTIAKPTNIGKSNERNGVEQATFEINSQYNDKCSSGGYHKDIADAHNKIYFEPMLAKKWDDLKIVDRNKYITSGAISQPKLDGVRCLATKSGLFSREGKPIVSVPHIYRELEEFLEQTNYTIDGELYNHSFKNDFNKIISLVRKTKPSDFDLEESEYKVEYWIYDIFDPKNPELNYLERNKIIHHLVQKLNDDGVRFIKEVGTDIVYTEEELDEVYSRYLGDGFEGQMLRYDKPYENKRSKFLLKRKEFQDEEFKIVKIHEGLGNWSGMAKAVEFVISDNKTAKASLKGSQEFAKQVLTESEDYVNGTVTVRFQNKTPDGIPRFPIAVSLYKGERDL